MAADKLVRSFRCDLHLTDRTEEFQGRKDELLVFF